MARIGIAVVEHRGRYLVGTRGLDGPLPGYAEFPGGKCEDDESPAQCAARECREETGLSVAAHETLLVRQFDYPHGTVELHFFRCTPIASGELNLSPTNGFRWVDRDALAALKFPSANAPMLDMLLQTRRKPNQEPGA